MPIAATHPFIDSLQHIAGFLIVLVALFTLWGVTVLLGVIFKRNPEPEAIPIVGEADEIDDEEVAAIAAIVASLVGRRSRIVSIRSSGAKDWNREGRREHFASHRIR